MALFYKFILDNFQDRWVICYRIDGANPLFPRALKTWSHNTEYSYNNTVILFVRIELTESLYSK